jgi:RNA polymerase sigma-70 factor (ECF subfamily)
LSQNSPHPATAQISNDSLLSDNALIRQVQAQQSEAFDLLFERYAETIRRHLLHIVREDHAAEDLLQEVFLRVWTRAEQWNGQGAFKGWLFRIATNLALNHIRAGRRHPEQPLLPPEDFTEEASLDPPAWLVDTSSLGPEAALEALEQDRHLRQIIQELPEEKRAVIQLVHQFELSLREAAEELGIPEGTARSRLHYARARLDRQWRAWQSAQE